MRICCRPFKLPESEFTQEFIDSAGYDVVPIATQTEIICSKCRAGNPENAKFCSQCGAALRVNSSLSMLTPGSTRTDRSRNILEESEPPPDPDQGSLMIQPYRQGTQSSSNAAAMNQLQASTGSAASLNQSQGSSGSAATLQSQGSSGSVATLQGSETVPDPDPPPAPSGSAEVVFWSKGDLFPIIFTHRPIGLKWIMKPPVKIDQVVEGSHAEELGIKKGWVVKTIEGTDFSGQNYKIIAKALNAAFDKLPWTGNSINDPGKSNTA